MQRRQSVLVIDNYDSFTFNLVRYLAELEAEVIVRRADAITPADALASGVDAFLISPGPGRPDQAGSSIELVEACVLSGMPLLGVCLGLQAIAAHFGAKIVHAPQPMHGKTDQIIHDATGVFSMLPSPFIATRYHSLVVDPSFKSDLLLVNGRSPDGTTQGMRHRHLAIHGVQFHPESAASQFGHALIRNFLEFAAA